MERHRLRTVGLALAISLGGLGGATAQTECDSVLKTELRKIGVKSNTRDQASRNFACSHDFQEFNDTYGGSASFTYGAIGGSGAYNQGNYKNFQQDRCSDATASDHQSGFEYYTLVDAGAGARTDWQKCMANLAGFHCWAEPESQDIAIVLSQKDLNPYKIRDVTLSESATLQSSRTLIMPEQPVPFGHMRIVIHRNDQSKSVGLTIDIGTTISGILTTNGCSVTIPAVVAVVVPPKPEQKAAQISFSAGENVTANEGGMGFILANSDFGAGVPVLNSPATGGAVEYTFSAASAGKYRLEVGYAAGESRPVSISINKINFIPHGVSSITGSWMKAGERWEEQGPVYLQVGPNILRLERKGAPFPHIVGFRLIPE